MKLHKLVLALGLVFSGGMLLSGCSDGSSSAGVPAEVPAISSKVKYQFVFVDSTTGTAITDPLNVTFTGAVALTAADGTTVTKDVATTTSDGFIAVGADFTSTNTEFSVLVGNRTLGWIETGTRVVGKADLTGDQVVTISLVNTNKAAAITSSNTPISMAVTDATADSTGKIATAVAVATTSKTVTVTVANDDGSTTEKTAAVGTAALSVPANTVGKAADGTPASGALKVSSTYYSNVDASSMTAFPGGFATSVSLAGTATLADVGGATSATDGAFVTGGFAQFNITDSSGKAIKNFDPPVEVGIDLPKGTKNADGTAVLVPGDKFPVWSFDDATGAWKFEKMGTVAEKDPVDANNYTVKFETSHLSSWNLDFYGATCTGTFNFTGRTDSRPLRIVVQGTGDRAFSGTASGITDSSHSFLRYPVGTKSTVWVYDGLTLVGAKGGMNLCNGGTIPLTFPVVPRGTLQVNTSEACANGTGERAVPAFVNAHSPKNGYAMGYTAKATSTSTVATKVLANRKVDTFTVKVYNPRKGRYETKTVTLTDGATTTVNFKWTMVCPSGGGN